jgi:hypothetical protein
MREAFAPPTWSNWALTIFGFIASVIGICSLRALIRQTNATETAANAAKKSSETSEQALRLTQRGIVGLEAAFMDENGQLKIILKNYGPTIARNVVATTAVKKSSDSEYPFPQRIGPFSIGADATKTILLSTVPILRDNFGQPSAVSDLNATVRIKYEDIFTETHRKRYVFAFDRTTFVARHEEEADE